MTRPAFALPRGSAGLLACLAIPALAACGSGAPASGSSAREANGEEASSDDGDRAAHASLDEPLWPAFPESMPDGVASCVRDYRDLAATPFPRRASTDEFSAWYAGPFQIWVDRYNAVRERCDATFEDLDEDGPHAQVILAVQSYLHVRMGQWAVPHEEEPQMFVMSRYWTLGASCTFDRCAEGPLEPWAAECRRQDRMLPPCPPVPAEEASPEGPREPAEETP